MNEFFLFIGILTSIVFYFFVYNKKTNPIANFPLLLLLFVNAFNFLWNGIAPIINNTTIDLEIINSYVLYLTIVLVYLNLKYLINTNIPKLISGFHLAIIFFAIPFLLLKNNNPTQKQQLISIGGNFIYYITYVFLILKNSLYYTKQINPETNSAFYEVKKKWIHLVLFYFSFLILRKMVVEFHIILHPNSNWNHLSYWIVILVWFLFTIKLLADPELLYGQNNFKHQLSRVQVTNFNWPDYWILNSKKERSQQDSELEKKINPLAQKHILSIESFFKNKFEYENTKFSTLDLSYKVSLPESHVKYIFKYHCLYTYPNFIAVLRIEKAKQLIESGYIKINTLEKLSSTVGFENYNTFYTNFKKFTHCTPKQFMLKKQQS